MLEFTVGGRADGMDMRVSIRLDPKFPNDVCTLWVGDAIAGADTGLNAIKALHKNLGLVLEDIDAALKERDA